MAQGRHAQRTLRGILAVVAIATGIVLLALGGVAFAAYRYDQASADRILPGVAIAGVDVGGMARSDAIAAVTRASSKRLNAPLTVRVAGRTWTVTPAQLGLRADVGAAVDRALQDSGSVGFFSRVWRRLRDQPLGVQIDLSYRTEGTGAGTLVSTIAQTVARSPQDAAVAVVDGKVRFTHARPGRSLVERAATRRLTAALNDGASTVSLPVTTVRPKVPDAKLGKTIVIDKATNELSFYDGSELVKTYPVATAMPGFDTPSGTWEIIDKRENPTWVNPAPDTWGASMPAVIPPGPGNPLGTRALYLDAPGIRIHGTYDSASVGTYASHGCIRMYIADSEELYPQVPIGTRVIIF